MKNDFAMDCQGSPGPGDAEYDFSDDAHLSCSTRS